MTFTTKLKEEITKLNVNNLELQSELAAYIRYAAKFNNNISITIENASVARHIYKAVKQSFKINPKIIVRNQRRFRIKQIYILEINERVDYVLEALNIVSKGKKIIISTDYLDSFEEKIAYLKGAFLACGSISDPATSGYHLEFVFNLKKDANFIKHLLKDLKIDSKIIIRNNKNMVYIKSSEDISDIIRMFKATNSLFYFEDIRIYRDHKNMVNRLNNCEIANQEKTLNAGLNQLKDIEYLKDNDLLMLLDEKTQLIISYREKYPESSFQELADIISLETDYKIGKSGINHHFIKVKNLVNKSKNK